MCCTQSPVQRHELQGLEGPFRDSFICNTTAVDPYVEMMDGNSAAEAALLRAHSSIGTYCIANALAGRSSRDLPTCAPPRTNLTARSPFSPSFAVAQAQAPPPPPPPPPPATPPYRRRGALSPRGYSTGYPPKAPSMA